MKSFYLFVSTVMLFGCTGTAVVLQEDTEAVSDLIDASVTATRTYYDELHKQQFEYMIRFIAARPTCNAESPLLFKADEGRCLTSAEKLKWRDCQDPAMADSACGDLRRIRPVVFSPQMNQNRQTLVTLLATLASYQRALGRVLRDDAFDTGDELTDLHSRLQELSNQIAELQGDDTSGENADDDLQKQLIAVSALIDLIRDAGQDRADFARLEVLVRSKGPTIDAALEDLLSTYEKVDKPLSDNLARSQTELARRAYNTLTLAERNKLTQEKREDALRKIYERESLRVSAAAVPDSLAEGLRRLLRSHKRLQKGFAGDLTKAQKNRIADENERQVKAAFKSMLNIVRLFT